MNAGPPPLPLFLLAAISAAAAAGPTLAWERRLVVEPVEGVALYAQAAGDLPLLGSQRIRETSDAHHAEYGFKNFNRDRLELELKVDKAQLQRYEAQFGYYKKDLEELKSWRAKANQRALEQAEAAGQSQEQLEAAVAVVQKEYERKRQDYLASRGFKLQKDVVSSDMPGLVRRSAAVVRPASLGLDEIAQKKRYDSGDLVGAAVSMVQTAMIYRVPPAYEGDKHTGGVLAPGTALFRGWGDCDTKSGVLASILSNWPNVRMVGVAVPDHYLVAVMRIPGKGDMFVEHGGIQYVLIEPAGPAWLQPGTVAASTAALLENAEGYRIEPF